MLPSPSRVGPKLHICRKGVAELLDASPWACIWSAKGETQTSDGGKPPIPMARTYLIDAPLRVFADRE